MSSPHSRGAHWSANVLHSSPNIGVMFLLLWAESTWFFPGSCIWGWLGATVFKTSTHNNSLPYHQLPSVSSANSCTSLNLMLVLTLFLLCLVVSMDYSLHHLHFSFHSVTGLLLLYSPPSLRYRLHSSHLLASLHLQLDFFTDWNTSNSTRPSPNLLHVPADK